MNRIDNMIRNKSIVVLIRVLLFILYYFLLIIFGIGIFVGAGWVTVMIPSIYESFDQIDIRVLIICLIVFIAMWWFCIQIGWYLVKPLFIFPKSSKDNYLEVSPESCPQLFSLIEDAASKTGNPMPKHVYLSPDINAAVFYDSINLWSIFFPSQKNLVVGIGLLPGLNENEIKAVLCHEFGHFSQQSMRVGVITYRLMLVIETMIRYSQKLLAKQAVAMASDDYLWLLHAASYPVRYISKLTVAFYEKIERKNRSLSRYMEFEADNVACKIVGSDVHISALCKIHSLSKRFDTFRQYLFRLNIDGSLLKDYLLGYDFTKDLLSCDDGLHISYVEMMTSPMDDESLHNSRIVVYDGWNTHPSLKERIDNAKAQDCYTSNSDTKDACLLIPEIITNKIGVNSQSKNSSNLKVIRIEDFKEWIQNLITNHRPSHHITPFLDSNFDRFSIPSDDELVIDSIVSPFTEDNKKLLLNVSHAQADLHTLYEIQKNNKNIHFSYMGNMNIEVNEAIVQQKNYTESLGKLMEKLNVDIYKFLWKFADDKQELKKMYLLLFFCKETILNMKHLHEKAEKIHSQLMFYHINGVSFRLKDETIDEIMIDFEQFIAKFDTELLAKLCEGHINKVFNVKQSINKWQDFLSEAQEGGNIVMFIEGIWSLLSNLHNSAKKEREKRLLCAYKGILYKDVND